MNCPKCNDLVSAGQAVCPNCNTPVLTTSQTVPQMAINAQPPAEAAAKTPITAKFKNLSPKIFYILAGVLVLLVIGIGLYIFKDRIPFLPQAARQNVVIKHLSTQPSVSQPSPSVQQTSPGEDKIQKTYRDETLTYFTNDELQKLGVITIPNGWSVQEEYKGIKFVRTPKASYTDLHLKILKKFIDNTPEVLLKPGPAAITTYTSDEIQSPYFARGAATAFVSGSYMFYDKLSFEGGGFGSVGDSSLDAAYYTFIHELMHNYQFNQALDYINPDALKDTGKQFQIFKDWIKYSVERPIFEDFSSVTEWEKRVLYNNEFSYSLSHIPYEQQKLIKTTQHGKSNIVEDMAEAVAGAVTADDAIFSQERLGWAYKFLGVNKDQFKTGKFPFHSELKLTRAFGFSVYDTKKKEEFKVKYELSDVKEYLVDNKTVAETQNILSTLINDRGWQGAFGQVAVEKGVEILKGDFSVSGRDMYVELRNYDNSTGAKFDFKGTWVTFISGYLF